MRRHLGFVMRITRIYAGIAAHDKDFICIVHSTFALTKSSCFSRSDDVTKASITMIGRKIQQNLYQQRKSVWESDKVKNTKTNKYIKFFLSSKNVFYTAHYTQNMV